MPKTYMIYMAAVWLSCFFSMTGCADVNPDEIRDADTEIIYRTPKRVTVVSDPTRVDSLWESVYASADGFDTTTYFDFIIEACAAGRSEEDVLWTINKFRSLQVQTGDETGRVPRTLSSTLNYSDANNIEFALQLASVALAEYYPSWSAQTKAAFDDFVDKGIYALWKHDNVAPTYSNIYMMHAWNLIALGEYLDPSRTWGDSLNLTTKQLADKGYEYLKKFYDLTATTGVHEYNSPTYLGVVAECVGFMCNYVKNSVAHEQAERLRDYVSLMIAANYYTPASVACGAMSRCYYRGGSGGKIDQLAGGMFAGKSMYAYNQLAAWTPTASALTVNNTYPRLAAYIFGDEKATYADGKSYWQMNAINYVDKYYSVSSAGHHYTGNGTEKSLNIKVRTDEHPVNINIAHYMEGRNDPYGFLPGKSSHVWTCFRDAYARSQYNNQFVVMQAGNGRDNPYAENLASHILIPKTNVDEIWVDNTKVTDFSSAPQGTTFFIKIDHVVVSVRFLYTFDKTGADRPHTLIEDTAPTRNYYVLADNERHFALRITTKLNDDVPASGDLAGVAMWWRADDCIRTPDQFERLRKDIMNAPVTVPDQKKFSAGNVFECYVMTPENIKLGIKGTFAKKKYYNRYIYVYESPEYMSEQYWHFNQTEAYGSSVDFSNFCASFFSINGWDVGREIFND